MHRAGNYLNPSRGGKKPFRPLMNVHTVNRESYQKNFSPFYQYFANISNNLFYRQGKNMAFPILIPT
jgi:hypothetical protein